MEELGHQTSLKTFDLQFVLPTKYAVVKVTQKLGVDDQCPPQLEIHATRGSQPLILPGKLENQEPKAR